MNLSEREIITKFPQNRPYLSEFTIQLERGTNFPFDGDCSLLTNNDQIIKFIKIVDKKNSGHQNWKIVVDSFKTAVLAEKYGVKMVLGILWASIQNSYGIKLIHNSALPCLVKYKTSSRGFNFKAEITVVQSIDGIIDPINEILSINNDISSKLLAACELFAAARNETTDRARFVGLVSSLEPLCEQTIYEVDSLNTLLSSFEKQISEIQIESNTEFDEKIKNSLIGRIQQLKRESVNQAIKRTIENYFPGDKEISETVIESYNIRSKVLHEGYSDPDFNIYCKRIEKIIRELIIRKIRELIDVK